MVQSLLVQQHMLSGRDGLPLYFAKAVSLNRLAPIWSLAYSIEQSSGTLDHVFWSIRPTSDIAGDSFQYPRLRKLSKDPQQARLTCSRGTLRHLIPIVYCHIVRWVQRHAALLTETMYPSKEKDDQVEQGFPCGIACSCARPLIK